MPAVCLSDSPERIWYIARKKIIKFGEKIKIVVADTNVSNKPVTTKRDRLNVTPKFKDVVDKISISTKNSPPEDILSLVRCFRAPLRSGPLNSIITASQEYLHNSKIRNALCGKIVCEETEVPTNWLIPKGIFYFRTAFFKSISFFFILEKSSQDGFFNFTL